MLEPIEGALSQGGAHRPAQLWRLRKEFRRELSVVDRGLAGRAAEPSLPTRNRPHGAATHGQTPPFRMPSPRPPLTRPERWPPG